MIQRYFLFLLTAILTVSGAKAQYASSSALASGTWVKIEVPAEGIYEITYDCLRSMGFSNPASVQVYGLGATGLAAINHSIAPYADDMVPTATLHTGSKLLFYGTGTRVVSSNLAYGDTSTVRVVANDYDTHSYYFLSDSGLQPIPTGVNTESSGTSLTSHIHVDWVEDDLFMPIEGGGAYLGQRYGRGDAVDYTFTIRNYREGTGISRGCFYYSFGVACDSPVRMSVTLPQELTALSTTNNSASASTTADEFFYVTGNTSFAPGELPDGTYTFTVNLSDEAMSMCAAERAVLRYPRANILDGSDPFLVMNLPSGNNKAGRPIVFPGAADADIHLWVIDDLSAITALKGNNAGDDKKFVIDRECRRLVAFNPSYTFPTPSVAGKPVFGNYHAAATPHMLIIATSEMMPAANDLADLHRRHQGMSVLVVDHNDLYDEFSNGSRDVMAYRRLAKIFHDRDPLKFRYLLFMGPSHYDNKGVTISTPLEQHLVAYEQDVASLWNSHTTNYTTDSYFAMLGDDYVHTNIHLTPNDISVGRIPAMNASQASDYVAKVRERMENPLPPHVWGHALLTAGSSDAGAHFMHQQEVDSVMRARNSFINFEHVYHHLYSDADERERLDDHVAAHLRDGVGYFTYSGHGNDVSISMWSNVKANSVSYDYPVVAMFSSCDQFAFDRMHSGLLETMLFARRGGAIAGVAASREVYLNYNQLACVPMAEAYASAVAGETLGEVYTRSRNSVLNAYNSGKLNITSAAKALRNMLSYNFAGDPAIPSGAPSGRINATELGGTPLTGTDPVKAAPLMPFILNGKVLTSSGDADAAFSGTVTLRILEGTRIDRPANVDNEDDFQNAEVESAAVLATFTGTVTDGVFSIEGTVPQTTSQAQFNRLLISAVSTDGRTAAGASDNFVIDIDASTELPPEMLTPPSILSLTVDILSFTSDKGSAVLRATVDPSPSGIVYTGGTLGTASRVILDRNTVIDNLGSCAVTSQGSVTLSVPIDNLSEGSHTAELFVANNAGKSDRATCSFEAERQPVTLSLHADCRAARDEVKFTLSGASKATLIITDSHGNTVHRASNVAFPCTWDLTDRNGQTVAPGLYTATALVSETGTHTTCTIVSVPE